MGPDSETIVWCIFNNKTELVHVAFETKLLAEETHKRTSVRQSLLADTYENKLKMKAHNNRMLSIFMFMSSFNCLSEKQLTRFALTES